MTAKFFDVIRPPELRKMQLKAAKKRVENQDIRCKLAVELFEKYGLNTVMSVLRVERRQAYIMIKRGREL